MDPIPLVAAALGAGLSAGLALVGVTVAALAALRPPLGTTGAVSSAALSLLLFGTIGGLMLAPLRSTYRRGGLALVCAFATVVVMQLYRPLDAAFGVPGLLGAAALALALAVLLVRRARRMAAP
jgi:hypothetical protein